MGLFDGKDEDLEDAYRYTRLQPHEQIAFEQRQNEQNLGAGVQSVLRGALGLPQAQSQSRGQAGVELRELVQKVAPGTVEFYTAGIDILRKHGLVGEAEEMAKKIRDLEIGRGERDSATMKLQRDKDQLLKRPDADSPNVKAAIAAIDRQLDAAGKEKEGSPPADPEWIKLLNAYEQAVEAGQGDRAERIKEFMDAYKAQKEKAGQPTGNPTLDYRKERDEKKDAEAKVGIISALQGLGRALNVDIQSAEALLAHPGLSKITGDFAGVTSRVGGAFSRGAYSLLLNVHAQTFLNALQALKATSKTGASGLGQLTENEGIKIQNARAALDPQQPTAQFKKILANYIGQLKAARDEGVRELNGAGAAVPAPLPPLLENPGKDDAPGGKPAGGAAARRAADAAPAIPADLTPGVRDPRRGLMGNVPPRDPAVTTNLDSGRAPNGGPAIPSDAVLPKKPRLRFDAQGNPL